LLATNTPYPAIRYWLYGTIFRIGFGMLFNCHSYFATC